MKTFKELDQFLTDLTIQEEWNALKLVIFGHGEVGKTTLLQAIRRYLESWFTRVWLFFSAIFICTNNFNYLNISK
jgi:hypothetical protein